MIDQNAIHKMTLSSNSRERVDAVRKIGVNFAVLPDKDQAWNDVSRMLEDENGNVRSWAAETIGIAFSYILDKENAWKCLIILSGDDNENVRYTATRALGRAFPHASDKYLAWNDMHELTSLNADVSVLRGVAEAFGWAFPHIPDKDQAWNDLHRLTTYYDQFVKRGSVWAIGKVFSFLPDKEMAWRDLYRLARDGISGVRWGVAGALGNAFPHFPDEEIAWRTLIRLTEDSYQEVRWSAAKSLGLAYPHFPDKNAAWNDIHRLTESYDDWARHGIAMSLGTAFPCIPDKKLAQEDLHGLTEDVAVFVRMWAANSMGIAFPYLPDKQQAWKDLRRLLTEDEDNRVKWKTIEALGQAFPHVPDRSQAWSNLQHFAYDEDNMLSVSANHSLGRASIFKAAKANSEDDFRNEMENALRFFEISSAKARESYNPSKFCLPFYNSFYAVTFKGAYNEAEVERYLGEAGVAIGLSKSRDVLLEAMEKLARALQRAQDWEEGQTNLDACRNLCDNAAILLVQAESDAPIAVEILRRGLPIIGRRIKVLLKEIEEESSKLSEATRKTPFEPLGKRTDDRTKRLARVEDQIEAERILDEIIPDIRIMCHFLPEKSRELLYELQEWDKLDFERKVSLFRRAISRCSLWIDVLSQKVVEKDEWIEYFKDEVIGRLNNINYNIFRLKIRSVDTANSLRALKWELDRIKAIKSDVDGLGSKLEDLEVSQQLILQELEAQMPRIIGELEMLAKSRRDDEVSQEILKKLENLKRAPGEKVFERASGLASIVGLLLTLTL